MNAKMQTGMQKALKMENVPHERFGAMVRRTIAGLLFAALGGFLLWVMLLYFRETKSLNLWLFIGGVSCMLLAGVIMSGQIVVGAILSLRAPIQMVKTIWKNGHGSNE